DGFKERHAAPQPQVSMTGEAFSPLGATLGVDSPRQGGVPSGDCLPAGATLFAAVAGRCLPRLRQEALSGTSALAVPHARPRPHCIPIVNSAAKAALLIPRAWLRIARRLSPRRDTADLKFLQR